MPTPLTSAPPCDTLPELTPDHIPDSPAVLHTHHGYTPIYTPVYTQFHSTLTPRIHAHPLTHPKDCSASMSTDETDTNRHNVLSQVYDCLSQEKLADETAHHLICQHQIEPDELTEVGLPYEMVRALEHRYPALFH
ncbi:MAG: hypothetical protein KC474_07630 [Cyanobacteria bacterium HKST-UBA04]|nr:hypothetical protein [Cyanobacteria bacterium HKST-UBA04]MCA9842205.1 hypothetical protein [Cyanobacteria bacterium HKST-UBA03]